MLLDKLCTICVVLFIDFLLFKKYINGYTKFNLAAILVSICGLSIYIYSCIKSVELYIYIQIVLALAMFGLPLVIYYIFNKDKDVDMNNIYSKVEKYIYDKNTSAARKCINKYLETNEEDSNICLFLGICDKIDKKYESATTNFMKAIEKDKNNYLAYYNIGTILEKEGKIDTAIVMLTNANKIKPDFYDAAELLGICYTSQRKYNDAEGVYLDALKYYPDSYELNYNIAVVNLERGYIDEAEEYLIKAVNLSNKPYGACYSLGNIYTKRGKYQNALENYKVARLDENLAPLACYKMAVIYSKIREYENATICLKYSILLDKGLLEKAKSELSFDKIIMDITTFEDNVENMRKKIKDDVFREKVMNFLSSDEFLDQAAIDSIFD